MKSLKERLANIMSLMLSCDFVEDIEVITSESSKLGFATPEENREIIDKDWDLPSGWKFSAAFAGATEETTQSEKSVLHKHFRAMGKIAESQESAIILEDDAIFDPQRFDEFMVECENMPSDLDWCFLGTGINPFKVDGHGFVKNNNKFKSKCADSMLITHTAAKIIYEDWKNNKANMPIDWDLNYRFLKHDFNVYWYEPGFIIQGSENGIYQTCHKR